MPVLTKINTNVIADDAVTAAKIPTDALGATDIAANAIGTSELADAAVLPANIAYLGDGSGNLSGTITNQQLHFGSAFTLTDDLTVNGDVTLGKVRDDGTGQSITGDGKTLTGTGTLTMGSSFEGGQPGRDDKTAATTSLTGLPGVIGSDVTGFTGIKNASLWRLTADFNGDADPATTMEEDDGPVGFGKIGESMTINSGRFTFPVTGYWLIMLSWTWSRTSGDERQCGAGINTTTDNSTYATAAWSTQGLKLVSNSTFAIVNAHYIFDVTDTSTHKCSVRVDPTDGATTSRGSSTFNRCTISFVRLGDT